MIYDKIKIYVTKSVYSILERDADFFEFKKKDGVKINKNAFLTSLIINYFEEFAKKQKHLNEKISNELKKSKLSTKEIEELSLKIAESINKEITASNEKFDTLVSLKPTKESKAIIDYIETYCLGNGSLSEYFRNMFSSYASNPQDKREEIIFNKTYSLIQKAITEHKKIFITTNSATNAKYEISPYSISRSKEEFHIYLLGLVKGRYMTIKLLKISSVNILLENSSFTKENLNIFEKMKQYGPQFIYQENDEEIKVRLTDSGLDKFKKFYVHRPIPCKIEGNIYSFNCSQDQVYQYFTKFGNDAYIISPTNLHNKISAFYRRAFFSYKSSK